VGRVRKGVEELKAFRRHLVDVAISIAAEPKYFSDSSGYMTVVSRLFNLVVELDAIIYKLEEGQNSR